MKNVIRLTEAKMRVAAGTKFSAASRRHRAPSRRLPAKECIRLLYVGIKSY